MRKILFLILLLDSLSLYAEDFKILYLNTESVKIGRTVRKIGDTFKDNEVIHWKKDKRQAMKVLSLDTKKHYVMVSEDFKQRKMKSAKDYLEKNNRLSTRGLGSLSTVSSQIGDKIYWLESASVSIDYEPYPEEYFLLKCEGREVALTIVDGQLVFDRSIWCGDEPHQLEADLYYHYKEGDNELVSSGILIVPMPSKI